VFWIGGGSGGGKTTIAGGLARRHHLRHVSTDDAMPDHASRLSATEAPQLDAFRAMSMDERWVTRSPREMLQTFHWFRGEGFDLIVEDLLSLPTSPRIIVDGFRLLPHLVAPLLADRSHALWLLPTPEFRVAAFDSRGTTWEIPRKTTDPERARDNLLERDRLFTEELEERVRELDLPLLVVGGGSGVEEVAHAAAISLGLSRRL